MLTAGGEKERGLRREKKSTVAYNNLKNKQSTDRLKHVIVTNSCQHAALPHHILVRFPNMQNKEPPLNEVLI